MLASKLLAACVLTREAWRRHALTCMQVWIAPGTGLANSFLEQLERLSQDSTAVMMAIFAVFALVHSGLAYLRPYGQLSLQPIR